MTTPDRELRPARAEAAIQDHVRRLVDSAPPLTPEQRDRIACLLRPVQANELRAAKRKGGS